MYGGVVIGGGVGVVLEYLLSVVPAAEPMLVPVKKSSLQDTYKSLEMDDRSVSWK